MYKQWCPKGWNYTSFSRVLSPHRPWQECSNVNSVISDHEATQKYLLSTHKYVGTRFKCNQCDQLAIQWCNLKSHKQSKCIQYQCGQCHYKPYKRNYLKSPAQLKNNDRDNFKDLWFMNCRDNHSHHKHRTRHGLWTQN